jgi:hypothetical protein
MSPPRSVHTGSAPHPTSYSLCGGKISLDVELLGCRTKHSPPPTVEVKGEWFLPVISCKDVNVDKLVSLYVIFSLLPHFTSLRLALPLFASVYLTSPHFTSFYPTLPHFTLLYFV